MNNSSLFILLIIGGALLAQEPPTKKSKIDDLQIKNLILHQPKSLAQIVAKHVIKNLSHHHQFLHFLPDDIREIHLNPLLYETLKKKFDASSSEGHQRVTTSFFDSRCAFTPTGEHIVSIHNRSENVQIYALKDILENNFERLSNQNYPEANDICMDASKNRIYYIDSDGHLREFDITKTSSSKQYSYLTERRKSEFAAALEGTINKILPHPKHGVLALTKPSDNQQNLYWLQMSKPSTLIASISEANRRLIQIYSLKNNCTAFMHSNGDLEILDNRYKKVHEFINPDKNNDFYSSAINENRTCITLGNKNGILNIYDLIENKCATLSYSFPFDVLTFYDNDHIIAAHKDEKITQNNEKILLSFWNIRKKICLAGTKQSERNRCNTLDVSPDKKHLLLGMGYYDIAIRPIDSFNFNVESINPEMIYANPQEYLDLQTNETITAAKKIAFINAHSKK